MVKLQFPKGMNVPTINNDIVTQSMIAILIFITVRTWNLTDILLFIRLFYDPVTRGMDLKIKVLEWPDMQFQVARNEHQS
jgi:hypothetical protein